MPDVIYDIVHKADTLGYLNISLAILQCILQNFYGLSKFCMFYIEKQNKLDISEQILLNDSAMVRTDVKAQGPRPGGVQKTVESSHKIACQKSPEG